MCSIGGLLKLGLLGLLLSWVAFYFRYGSTSLITAKRYSLGDRPQLDGALKPNNLLQSAKYILKDEIVGPESILVEDDVLYTGLYDGRVVKIVNGEIVKEVRFSKAKECGTFESEPQCGRPLGIRRLNPRELVVADAYLGIYAVDFESGKFRQLVSSRMPVDGRPLRFLNDIDVLNEDEVIFSDSSDRWERRYFMNIILEHSAGGRVLKHKISTSKTTVLADQLVFPNGIQLTADKKEVFIAELGKALIKRVDISSGKVSVFAENLPGLPDNIRLAEDGTLWVAFAGVRHAEAFSILDVAGDYPHLRQLLLDTVPGKIWTNYYSKIKPPHAMIAQIDASGQIISSLHDLDGKVITDSSQITAVGDKLYIGSYHSPFIAVL